MARTPALIAVVITAFLCASCTTAAPPSSTPPAVTPSTSITSTSPSATPTPSWSAEQEAANQAVDDYRAAIGSIEVDPAAFSAAQMTAILKKVAEEAAEVLLAAKDGDKLHLVRETADLWFHTLVLLSFHGLGPDDVLAELRRREGISGIDEKAARPGG